MSQNNSSTSSPPFFSVTRQVTFKPMTPEPERRAGHLPSGVAQIISLVSLGAVLLGPLSGCNSVGSNTLPCPVPTSKTTTNPNGTSTAKCTTSSGTHYLWVPSNGGWVQSDDGVHPNAGAHGSGEDSGHTGVGDGHSGSSHGGSEGG